MPYIPTATDVFRIPNPEPGWHYRWLSDNPEMLSAHFTGHGDRPGYAPVRGKNKTETLAIIQNLGLAETYYDPVSGYIKYGRLVLGKIPKTEQLRRKRELASEYAARFQTQQEEYLESATRRGIRPFVREVGEIEDRKKFAARQSDPTVSLAGVDIPADSGGEE